ncbi:unnamed protein product [Trichogramma brassicae]|uniref:C2H2-type domain-containing protein n=1 Tax=Trichogramma brassicae TaxID=86971 RepID=A0A6H5ISL0_9HYME|nr:unnamed protein product [Trichogramma brassicae]
MFLYTYVFNHTDHVNNQNFEKLKSIREKINWEIEDDRRKLLRYYSFIIKNWDGVLPSLRAIFRPEEIEWLLAEDMKNKNVCCRDSFSDFVIRSGYKDEPDVDADGKLSSRRTTPLHRAAIEKKFYFVHELFKIFDRFDVNYANESGLTHFHVACEYGLEDIVDKFLEHEHDLNCIEEETGNTALHLALAHGHKKIAESLLRSGADPNLANAEGSTALHVVCRRHGRDDLVEIFFANNNDDGQKSLLVDARDKKGRTPLQLAVANLLPNTVDTLLDHGAVLSSFVFPSEAYFGESFEGWRCDDDYRLRLVPGVLAVIECLERRGFELDRSNATTITAFFAKCGLFDGSLNLSKFWYFEEKFATQAKGIMITPRLSLYDLIRLRPEEATKLLSYKDYFDFACSFKLCFVIVMNRLRKSLIGSHRNALRARSATSMKCKYPPDRGEVLEKRRNSKINEIRCIYTVHSMRRIIVDVHCIHMHFFTSGDILGTLVTRRASYTYTHAHTHNTEGQFIVHVVGWLLLHSTAQHSSTLSVEQCGRGRLRRARASVRRLRASRDARARNEKSGWSLCVRSARRAEGKGETPLENQEAVSRLLLTFDPGSRTKQRETEDMPKPTCCGVLVWRFCTPIAIKSFECEICRKSFGSQCHLKRQVNTVHDRIESFECDICHKSFRRKGHLKIHLMTGPGKKSLTHGSAERHLRRAVIYTLLYRVQRTQNYAREPRSQVPRGDFIFLFLRPARGFGHILYTYLSLASFARFFLSGERENAHGYCDYMLSLSLSLVGCYEPRARVDDLIRFIFRYISCKRSFRERTCSRSGI